MTSGDRFHTLTPVSKAALQSIAVHTPHRQETMARKNLGRIELRNTTDINIFTQTQQRLSLILPRLSFFGKNINCKKHFLSTISQNYKLHGHSPHWMIFYTSSCLCQCFMKTDISIILILQPQRDNNSEGDVNRK